MGKRRKTTTKKMGFPPFWQWGALLGVLATIVLGSALFGRRAEQAVYKPDKVGGVYDCRRPPKFIEEVGFSPATSALSTSERTLTGVVLVEPQTDGTKRTYQHPSWSKAGHLGPTQLDKNGYLYVAPSPRVDLVTNPLENQNTIYRLDTLTQVLVEWVKLPSTKPISAENPFGIVGLAYDCETNSLYVSSVAGSGRDGESGQIFRVDVATGEISAEVHNVDALGLAPFNGIQDKRLYYASARTQEIRSIPLNRAGNFVGSPRLEFSLAETGSLEKGRRLTFQSGNQEISLIINGVMFNYNLAPPSSTAAPTVYRYLYNSAEDRWVWQP